MTIKDKVVLITGASSGIGAATAKMLAGQGAKVMLLARREEKLHDLVSDIGDSAEFAKVDVTDYDSVNAAVQKTIDTFGKLDVIINNAGLGYLGPMEEAAVREWKTMVDVNVTGVLNTIHASLPHLLESQGHIINIDSVAGHNYFPNAVVYCATKHAVKAISYGIRVEFRSRVKVTNISPGAVETEFIDNFTHQATKEAMTKNFEDVLKADDIAEAILEVLAKPSHVVINEVTIRPNK
ncbi:MAG: SDR family oxidoreductase [Bacteroidia bacterium]|nr:SDR family oxidoreductase [Bacteroidia bacterium]